MLYVCVYSYSEGLIQIEVLNGRNADELSLALRPAKPMTEQAL